MFRHLDRDELRRQVRIHATAFARRHYEDLHPRCNPEEAWAYAERHWQQFIERALDNLAIADAAEEAAAAAMSN